MAQKAPLVEGTTLLDQTGGGPKIEVGTAAWQGWLEQASSFAFRGSTGRFTARKERRGRADGYWRAYRKQSGKLYSLYLGKSADLSLDRLEAVALALVEAASTPAAVTTMGPGSTAEPTGRQGAYPGIFTVLLADCDPLAAQGPIPDAARIRLTRLLNEAIRAGSGRSFAAGAGVIGGSFGSPIDALDAALTARRLLEAEDHVRPWAGYLRMALHTGVPTVHGEDDSSDVTTWALRLLSSGHGGQILLSLVSSALIKEQLPPGYSLSNLGSYYLDEREQPESLFQFVGPYQAAHTAPLRAPARRPHNLPVSTTSFVGRSDDVFAVVAALQRVDVRLLTLTGPGGVGKTRLALQVARELRDHFADGAFLVDLASIVDPALVIPTILKTLGLTALSEQTPHERLKAYLATKQMLLLLDNFEQVLPATTQVASLLAAAPSLTLLVTSRAALQVAGAHEYPVAPLALPSSVERAEHTAAIALFVQRAQAVKPDFALGEGTAPAIAEICRRLDGLPLAIELAAARIKLFSPAALLQRLDRRLPLLSGARDLPARQQTMGNTCDWSYRLLDAPAQTLFRQLAVFVGGFSLEAAEAVCAGVDELVVLVDQSLLSPGEDATGEPRFAMLGTLHEYALELLEQSGEAPTLRQRHAHHFTRLAERVEPELTGPDARIWLDRLEAELPNLRAALHWLLTQHEAEAAARLGAALRVFWYLRAHQHEGQRWLEAALAQRELLAPTTCARLLRALGYLAHARFDFGAAVSLLGASLALYRAADDERGRAAVVTELGWAYVTLHSDADRAAALLQEGLDLYRRLDDRKGIALALHGLGWVEQLRAFDIKPGIPMAFNDPVLMKQPERLDAARALVAESLLMRRLVGDKQGIAWLLQILGYVARVQGAYEAARSFQEERLEIERALGNRHGIAVTSIDLGQIAYRQGDAAAARARLVEGLALAREVSNTHITALALIQLGEIALASADFAQSTALLEEALACFREINDTYRSARACSLLAQVALEQDRVAEAQAMARACLELAGRLASPELVIRCLNGLAASAARRGHWAWAAQLWGAAQVQFSAAQLQPATDTFNDQQQLIEAARAAVGARAFATAWAAGRLLTPEAAVNLLDSPGLQPENTTPARSTVARQRRLGGLTARELEVLLLLAEGLSNAQIADRLVLSISTVKTYLSVIYDKIGVRSRTAAMRYLIDMQPQPFSERV